jgi:hypothetical protein
MALKNHWFKLALGVAVLLAIIGGCGGDNDTPPPVTPDSKEVGKTKSFLFVQNASSGTFVADGNGSYTLSLSGVSPQTIFFSDRPARDTGQIEMEKFVTSSCFDNFNPPNAAIDVMGVDEGNDVVIVELTNPVYDADSATLNCTARILDDRNHSIASFNTRRDASIPEAFGAVALFIDDCSDVKIACGNKEKKKAGEVTCCRCWDWIRCTFTSHCCSFERCQRKCTDKYGSENNYLRICGGWFKADGNNQDQTCWWYGLGGVEIL